MINITELYDLITRRYLNCYREYIDLLDNRTNPDLRYNLLHRMNIYYEILEVVYDTINEYDLLFSSSRTCSSCGR